MIADIIRSPIEAVTIDLGRINRKPEVSDGG
jgi:hypothetical protein